MQQFVVFSWCDTENGAAYHLIQNKGAQGALESSMKAVDYWLRVENAEDFDAIILSIKNIPEVQMVHEIKPSDLKKNSLVFRNPLYQSNL